MADEPRKSDRGGGIFVQGGFGFRLRDIHLSFDATTGELVESSMIPEVRADTFQHWLAIAELSSDQAELARTEALEADLKDDDGFGLPVSKEYRSSMIAIAAAAFAMDAFYASVVLHALRPSRPRRPGTSESSRP